MDFTSFIHQTDDDDIDGIADDGYIMAGYTESFGAGRRDVWVLKLDHNGNVGNLCNLVDTTNTTPTDTTVSGVNTATVPFSTSVSGTVSTSTQSDSYITEHVECSGYTETNPKSWANEYGGSDDDFANSIQQTSDGGYIVAGYTSRSFGEGVYDVWVLKLNPDGTIDWQRTYGGVVIVDQAAVSDCTNQNLNFFSKHLCLSR